VLCTRNFTGPLAQQWCTCSRQQAILARAELVCTPRPRASLNPQLLPEVNSTQMQTSNGPVGGPYCLLRERHPQFREKPTRRQPAAATSRWVRNACGFSPPP